jgi:hypothetical protein
VKATLGAALGITARPGGGVDGEDQWPVPWSVRNEQLAQRLVVDPALGQCLVEAPVAAGELGLQGERGDRVNRTERAQRRVGELEERIAPSAEGAIEPDAKGPQRPVVMSSHVRSCYYYRTPGGGSSAERE